MSLVNLWAIVRHCLQGRQPQHERPGIADDTRHSRSILLPAIDYRVQCGIVVHLHLPIELDAAFSSEHLLPQPVEAANQVGLLIGQNVKALAIAIGVARRSILANHLLLCVKQLERQDGETVDDEAGSFRVQFGTRGRQRPGVEPLHQQPVARLSEIVAALVDAIDGVLHVGDVVITGAGSPGLVLFVPQLKVSEVLFNHPVEKCIL